MIDKAPNVLGKRAEFFLNHEKLLGVFDGALDFKSVADDAGIFHKPLDIFSGETCDFFWVEFGEGFAIPLASFKNGKPA